MDKYERTIDLMHVVNYVKYNLKKIIIATIVVGILSGALFTVKNLILPSEKLYYSTAKILFKFDSWSTSEKDYSLENWNLSGTELYKSDSNYSFISNSKHIFSTDKIFLELMEKYNVDKSLSKFKKNVIVEKIPESDIVKIIVTASTPEMAEDMLNTIISEGIDSVKNLYELKYEIMDKYTMTDKSFSKLQLNEYGEIEVSSDIKSDIKLGILISIAGFLLSIVYYVLKCLLNSKIESLEQIEGDFGLSVLEVVGRNYSGLLEAATKLINSEVKTILITSDKKEEKIGTEIIELSKSLNERNKKSLIICADTVECNNVLELHNIKEEICVVNGINIINVNVMDVDAVVENNKNKYDFVLIVSKCLSDSSDALLLSKKADFTLLITKCNFIDMDRYNRIVQEFNKYCSGIDGVLLKDVTKESSAFKFIRNNM